MTGCSACASSSTANPEAEDVQQIDVDLTGVRVLDLVVGEAGDCGYNDRADWAGLAASC